MFLFVILPMESALREADLAEKAEEFARGAADPEEEVGWVSHIAVESDEEQDQEGDEGDTLLGEQLMSAALQLAPLSDGASTTAVQHAWEKMAGYIPPGQANFNAFARERMLEANVPYNKCVLPPAELLQALWAAGPQKPRLQPEIMNFVLAFGQWVAATGSAVVFIAGCTLWARLILGWVIWPSLLAAAFILSNI